MHILFDATFPARNPSGIGVYGRELLAALRAAEPDWRIESFVAPGFPGRTRAFYKLADAGGWLWGVEGQLPYRVWRRPPDVLHAPAFIAPLVALPCPLVVTVHDTILEDGWQPFHPAWRVFHRLSVAVAVRRAAAIIVPTATTAADLARVYGVAGPRVHVVPYGLSGDFRPWPAEAVAPVLARYALSAPYILFVGAQVRRKNIVRLLEAFARLRAERGHAAPGLTLVLIGPPGDASPAIARALGELGLGPAVRRLSGLPRADVVALMNGARVLAFPSLYEGGGLPPLEAMACGVPVVAGDTGAVRDVTGGAALLVEPTRVDALANALARCLADDGLCAELRARGLARAAHFTWARAARETRDVYAAVGVGRTPGAGA